MADAEVNVENIDQPVPTTEAPLGVVEAQEAILKMLDAQEAQPEQEEEQPTEETEPQPEEDGEVEVDEADEDETESEEDEEEYEPEAEREIEGDDVDAVYSINVGGENIEVTLEELQAGYSRQSDYTKKTQEIAEERKGLEQYQAKFNDEFSKLSQERQQYQQALGQLGQQLSEGLNKYASVDWARLKEEDPIAYVTKRDEFREEQERIKSVQGQQQQIAAQQQNELQQAHRQMVSQESVRLVDLIPDWGNPEKQPKLAGAIKSYGSSQGYTADELNNLIDSRSVNVLMKAMKYDAIQNADLKTKKVKNKPKMVKPGAKRSKVDAARKRKAKSMKQLQESGGLKDAAALFEDIL